MPLSLTDQDQDQTYVGLLHAQGAPLPFASLVRIYDGYGNPTSLTLGQSGIGATVNGPVNVTSLNSDSAVNATTVSSLSGVTSPNVPKAWAVFRGADGVILSGFNIGSVTRNSAGDYTIIFSNALSTANYAVSINMSFDNTSNHVLFSNVKAVPTPSTAQFSIQTKYLNSAVTSNATTGFDPVSVSVVVHHI